MTARYRIFERLGTTARSHLYRAQHTEDGTATVVKLPDSENLTSAQSTRFRHEYDMLQSLDLPSVVKPSGLIDDEGQLMMVLDNVAGEPLESVLIQHRPDFPTSLRMACQLASLLEGLHAAHLVHHDLRPANLIVAPAGRICLTDLSLATSDIPQTPTASHPLGGDWAYRSPEQTGRMNRAVDYRTDFYSLGVTLYRMLTGQLPFVGNDALEWAHCHIARLPTPPAELNPDIPPAVSAIVMKLLAKMPEDRYQSAHGLLHDLEICLAQWENCGTIAPFALGRQDLSERFQIPQKLVGREAEVKLLLASFDAMALSGRAALLLVSGAAGIGKSALVHELHRPIMDRRGYFISGKFDQYQRGIPYATMTQAFREMVQQILAESEDRIAAWRRHILEAVGANGQLIVDVLPQVELIIGKQKQVAELPPAEAQNRFHMAFQKFIGVFAQQAHPLTLFLDDLQWADGASLRLIRELVTSAARRFLLVVGAYRDSEVGPTHPLALTLDDMRREGAAITQIALAPFSEEALGIFLNDMLQGDRYATAPVAHLVYQKTAGNPYFVIQFISALAEERLIAFDAGAKTWRWDLARISAKGYTDNVAEFMIGKLARLPTAAQAALQRLACMGSCTPQDTLVTACDQPEAETQEALSAALRAGLLLRTDGILRFPHDRVQEAAYLSIPASARAALHLQIGRLLMAGKTPAQIEEQVFDVVNQLNHGVDCITDAAEKALLCRLDFLAGKKAKVVIAYASALGYFTQASALLPPDAWRGQYEETFALSLAQAECEYLAGHFQQADQLFDRIVENARSSIDHARVGALRMQLYQVAGRFDDALATGLDALRLLGVAFPDSEQEIAAAFDAEVRDIQVNLAGRRIAELAASPEIASSAVRMSVSLIVAAGVPAYNVRPSLWPLLFAKGTNLCVRYGNAEDAGPLYCAYAIMLIKAVGDVRLAFEFADMALRVAEKFGDPRRRSQVLGGYGALYHWLRPIGAALPLIERGFRGMLEVGDLANAAISSLFVVWTVMEKGEPLDEVLKVSEKYLAFAKENHNDTLYQTIRLIQQFVASLQGVTREPANFDNASFSEAACLTTLTQAMFGAGISFYHILKQMAAVHYGQHGTALAAAAQMPPELEAAGAWLYNATHHFYRALAVAALYPSAGAAQQQESARILEEELHRLKRWADDCPENFLDRYALVGAEVAGLEGRDLDAMRLYQQAIQSAHENGFIQNEALADELASKFYRARGFDLIADTYLREARAAYLHWGADGKVAQLDASYPQLRPQPAGTPGLAEGGAATQLDVLSVAKASQAISGQLKMNELADTLLHIVLENAGAQSGWLLLSGNEGLALAAAAKVDQAAIHVRFYDKQTSAETSLPTAILNYVRRSREQVLLPDVAQPNQFSADPYFAGHHPKSVLCLPILRQNALIGLLYLENNLITHAFAPERVAVLKLLASQAAISLENVQLYANLLQENSERKRAEDALREEQARLRRLVDANIIGVFFWDTSGGISEANDAFLQLSGYTREDLRAGNLRWSDMTPQEDRAHDLQALNELKHSGLNTPYEKEYIRKDGSRVPVMVGGTLFEGSQDQGIGFALDLSALKQAEERTFHMAHHDALTGLPNRLLFQDHIKLAIAHAHRTQSQVAVLFIDLDYFKNINDSLGHHIGDAVLQMTSTRLQKCLREGDSVARLGGDEFVFSLPLLTDSSDAARVAQKALDTLAQPFIVDGHELHISGSIGISLYPDDGTDVETLMRTADTAMYHAKEMGRGNFQFFTAALNQAVQQRLDVGTRLRHALAHNEFVLHYQPQVDMESGIAFSAEALLRWQPPGTAPLSCGAFIANAEESGLIVPIGEWALRQACRQLKIWHDAGHPELKMAVNLSPRQLEQPDFCPLVGQILKETGIPASALELEITESTLMQRSEFNLATLIQLSEMGIQLSVDDFGTGYSSLAYLQRFPVHALKIDQSFVRGIGANQRDTALVTAIIAMANSLQLKVLAEGVETLQQAQFLLSHDCLSAQGFYYSEAVPAEVFPDILHKTCWRTEKAGVN